MDKVKIVFNTPESSIINYNGVDIEVKPFFSISEQVTLIKYYLEVYFNINSDRESIVPYLNTDYVGAEYNLKHSIMALMTNVDTDDLDTDMYDYSDLWDKIKSAISNYYDFREVLDVIVYEFKKEKELEKSLGSILESLSNKLFETLDSFSKFSPEDVEKVKNTVLEMSDKLNIQQTFEKKKKGKK